MNIIKSNNKVAYERTIESMGTGLVLFKINVKDKHIGANYHLFYENGWKPPLDVAINVESLYIEYISFFAQDETIIKRDIKNKIYLNEDTIKIEEPDFSEKNYEKSFQKDFDILKVKDDIILLSKAMQEELLAYQLNESNYVLCDKGNNIVGMIMKRISKTEFEVLKESRSI